jgi:hypothetical protein
MRTNLYSSKLDDKSLSNPRTPNRECASAWIGVTMKSLGRCCPSLLECSYGRNILRRYSRTGRNVNRPLSSFVCSRIDIPVVELGNFILRAAMELTRIQSGWRGSTCTWTCTLYLALRESRTFFRRALDHNTIRHFLVPPENSKREKSGKPRYCFVLACTGIALNTFATILWCAGSA